MGIDYGLKRVGIAITDPLGMFAYPLETLENDKNFWTNLLKLINSYDLKKIVLGYPLKESGEKSDITLEVEEFREKLQGKISCEIEYVDERYSSSIAKNRIIESVPSKKKRRNKGLIDKNAAAIILEDYMKDL